MSFRYIYLFLSLFTFKVFAISKVIEVDHFDRLSSIVLEEVDSNTLVLFDVDDVLLRPTDEYCFREEIRLGLMKKIGKASSVQEKNDMFADFFLKREVVPVNKKMKEVISELQNRSIPHTALTAWWTGAFGRIKEMEKVRFKDLNEVNISFKDSSPFTRNVSFPAYRTEKGGVPMILDGVILVAFGSKGEILGLALDELDHDYKKIIFIDDHKKYVDQVETLCKNRNISYVGIHYTEASKLPMPNIDPAIEKQRFEILEKEHVWLNDKELLERVSYISSR